MGIFWRNFRDFMCFPVLILSVIYGFLDGRLHNFVGKQNSYISFDFFFIMQNSNCRNFEKKIIEFIPIQNFSNKIKIKDLIQK